MRVRIEIDSGDGILTKRQNAELDDMLAVVLSNAHLPAVSSFDHLGGVRGDSHIAGYFVDIPEPAPYSPTVKAEALEFRRMVSGSRATSCVSVFVR